MADILSNLSKLRRFLFDTPLKSKFNFTPEVSKDIRKELFLAISNNGEYLDWFFPNVFNNHEGDRDELVSQIDTEFEWQFSKYYKSDLCTADSKYNTHNHDAFHSSLPCSRIFRKGEPIYRCLTCGFDETCALCSNCYNPDCHEGHQVHITICQRENGGVCDCGDPEAWVKDYVCRYASKENESSNMRNREIPANLEESFFKTVEILLDYVIDVISQCNSQFNDKDESESYRIQLDTNFSSLNPTKYGYVNANVDNFDKYSDKYYLMVYNDQIRHYRDALQRIHLASRKVPQFAVMVADKVQNYGRAKVISSSDISLLRERQNILSATGLATCIRNYRDVFREDMCNEILIWINGLTESEMFKSHNRAKDLFCKAFCGKWNIGLLNYADHNTNYKYKVGTLDQCLKIPKIPSNMYTMFGVYDKSAQPHWNFKPSRWDLPDNLSEFCDYNLSLEDYLPHKSHLGSRLQYFIYLDIRFWKSIRVLLHDMYSSSLITNLYYKKVICCQYVDIYPAVADMFLTMDREPELNVMCTLSTQLFTCPSNSTSIVRHGDLSRIFASIYGFLTVEEIKSPECVDISHEISMKSLKNRRWGQIFFDIGYILSRSRDSKSIFTNNIIPMACDILALFQGRPVLKRESKNHIEYESPDYTAFFHAILVIYQFAEYIAHCLDNLKDTERDERNMLSKNAISYVVKFLLRLENNNYPGLADDYVDINLSKDKLSSKELIDGKVVADFNINEEKFSFLHPIHSFLSWIIEISDLRAPGEIDEVINNAVITYKEEVLASSKPFDILNGFTSIFEYSIRTIVLMSQIKSGFWVRNGFSVRSQLQLYRNTGLRESGYLRDLFLTQIFINSTSPDLVCYIFFNRWLLLDGFMQVNPKDSLDSEGDLLTYDSKTLPYMVEEILSFFIHILTEDLYLRGLKTDQLNEIRIKKEIIHNLCFGPMNYTKLCSHIPDHITAEKKFDLILENISNFTPPSGPKGDGIYKLKDEYFEQIDPYYFNYTTNTKDDAIKFVKDCIHKKTRVPISEVVITPKVRSRDELRVYKNIGNFSVSSYFRSFLIRALQYSSNEDVDKIDIILESTLHLIHICSFEEAIDIDKYGSFYDSFIHISQDDDVSIAVLLYKIVSDGAFKDHHSKVRSIFKVFEDKYHNLTSILNDQVSNFDPIKLEINVSKDNNENDFEKKKRIAKEKQSKLMAKFKKQQSLFLLKNQFEATECSDTEMEGYEEEDVGWKFPEPRCLLCQNASEDAGPFGIITYISKSSEFRNVPFDNNYWFLKSFSDSANLDENENDYDEDKFSDGWKQYMSRTKEMNVIGPGFPQNENVDSKLVSLSCGHGMHFQCYMNYLNSNRNRLNQITRSTPENAEHKEFLCPLCKAINNMFVPILWTSNKRSLPQFLRPTTDLSIFDNLNSENIHNESWFHNFTESINIDIELFDNLTPTAREMIGQSSTANATPNQQHFRMLLSNMFQILSLLTFPQILKADSTNILVNTIKSTEIELRGVSSNHELVVNQLYNNSLINLRTMNEFRNTSLLMKIINWIPTPNPKSDAYIKILANMLTLTSDEFYTSILERDFFEVLVNVFPLPRTGYSFNSILQMCFLGQVIQNLFIIATETTKHNLYKEADYSIFDIPVIANVDEKAVACTISIFKKLMVYSVVKNFNSDIIDHPHFGRVIYSMLVKASTPFLRRAAIYSFINCAETDTIDFTLYDNYATEAEKLCSFMNIDNLNCLLWKICNDGQTYEGRKFDGFITFLTKLRVPATEKFDIRKTLEYPGIVKLIDLPDRLDYFFTKYYYLDRYNNPHMSIVDPAICLFCGEVVDAQKSAIGNSEGQCTTHFLKECCNSVGIFLLPKERFFLLMHKKGGSFYNAPYLDQHGELAGDTKKGKTLHLKKARYNNFIRNMWLQHNVSNYVVRKLDSVMDAGGWDTL